MTRNRGSFENSTPRDGLRFWEHPRSNTTCERESGTPPAENSSGLRKARKQSDGVLAVMKWLRSGIGEDDSTGWLRRFSWPSKKAIGGRDLELKGYMFVEIAISESKGIVAVSAIDQTDVYIDLYPTPQRDRALAPSASWEGHEGNLINGLEFSPSGSVLVWALGGDYYWWTRRELPSPSEGGVFDFGRVFVWQIAEDSTMKPEEVPLSVELPAGWTAEDPEDMMDSQMTHGPEFVDDTDFRLFLPTGEWRYFRITGSGTRHTQSRHGIRVRDVAHVTLRTSTD